MVFATYTIFLRLRNIWRAKRWQRLESLWEPVILEILMGEGTNDDIWQLIKPKESALFVDYCLRFAQRLRGEEANKLKKLTEPYLPVLVKRLKKGDPPQRARAARTLSMLGSEQYHEVIEESLDDPSPLVAMIAARALAQRGAPDRLAAVINRLHRFDNWSRSYLAAMLTAVGPEAAPILRKTLIDTNMDTRVRVLATDALRALNDLEAGDPAATALDGETDRDLSASILRLLSEVGRPEHLENVRPFCFSKDFVVRAQAFKVLGRLGSSADLDILRIGIEDKSPWTAIQAARGLKEVGGESLLRKLAAGEHPRAELARQVLAEGSAG